MQQKLVIEYVPIETLVPYERNTKLHPAEQVKQIADSINRFGMNDPIAVDPDTLVIIEGHGRLMACKDLGFEEVPIIRLQGMTEQEQNAYRIAHNKITENGEFDMEMVLFEIENSIGAIPNSLIGFTEEELSLASANLDKMARDVEKLELDTPKVDKFYRDIRIRCYDIDDNYDKIADFLDADDKGIVVASAEFMAKIGV